VDCRHACVDRYQVYESEHVITNELPGVFLCHSVIRRRMLSLVDDVTGDEVVAVNHALMR
jgi:vancomycin resistance protein VanW